VWAVGKFAVALMLVVVAALFLLFACSGICFARRGPPAGRSQVAASEPAKAFPQPQLQEQEVLDLKAIRAAEDQVLNSYAWMDPKRAWCGFPSVAPWICWWSGSAGEGAAEK